MKLTKTQKELLFLMKQGKQLWSFPSGYELEGRPFWPRDRRTVEKLLDAGLLGFNGKENETQRECGILSLEATEAEGE